jgi:LysM repeat protein
VEDLRRWNHLKSSAINPHRTLDVSEPVHLAPAVHVRTKSSHTAKGVRAKAGKQPATASAKKRASNKKPRKTAG